MFNQIVKRFYHCGETKLDNSISSSEIEIEGYLRLDRFRRGGGVVCYIKKSLAYNYKEKFG